MTAMFSLNGVLDAVNEWFDWLPSLDALGWVLVGLAALLMLMAAGTFITRLRATHRMGPVELGSSVPAADATEKAEPDLARARALFEERLARSEMSTAGPVPALTSVPKLGLSLEDSGISAAGVLTQIPGIAGTLLRSRPGHLVDLAIIGLTPGKDGAAGTGRIQVTIRNRETGDMEDVRVFGDTPGNLDDAVTQAAAFVYAHASRHPSVERRIARWTRWAAPDGGTVARYHDAMRPDVDDTTARSLLTGVVDEEPANAVARLALADRELSHSLMEALTHYLAIAAMWGPALDGAANERLPVPVRRAWFRIGSILTSADRIHTEWPRNPAAAERVDALAPALFGPVWRPQGAVPAETFLLARAAEVLAALEGALTPGRATTMYLRRLMRWPSMRLEVGERVRGTVREMTMERRRVAIAGCVARIRLVEDPSELLRTVTDHLRRGADDWRVQYNAACFFSRLIEGHPGARDAHARRAADALIVTIRDPGSHDMHGWLLTDDPDLAGLRGHAAQWARVTAQLQPVTRPPDPPATPVWPVLAAIGAHMRREWAARRRRLTHPNAVARREFVTWCDDEARIWTRVAALAAHPADDAARAEALRAAMGDATVTVDAHEPPADDPHTLTRMAERAAEQVEVWRAVADTFEPVLDARIGAMQMQPAQETADEAGLAWARLVALLRNEELSRELELVG